MQYWAAAVLWAKFIEQILFTTFVILTVEGYLDFRNRPKEYIKARIREAEVEAELAEEVLKRGLYQNAANKAFMAFKALASALVVLRLDDLARDEKRREWYMKVGYAAPTTGLLKIAKDLEALGFKGVEHAARIALGLHRFAYIGFDPNFVEYTDIEDVESDVEKLLGFVREMLTHVEDSGGQEH